MACRKAKQERGCVTLFAALSWRFGARCDPTVLLTALTTWTLSLSDPAHHPAGQYENVRRGLFAWQLALSTAALCNHWAAMYKLLGLRSLRPQNGPRPRGVLVDEDCRTQCGRPTGLNGWCLCYDHLLDLVQPGALAATMAN